MLGTFILWFGWYGFNPGSAILLSSPDRHKVAGLAACTTTLAAGTASISALFINLWLSKRETGETYFDLGLAMNGVLSGLVAITAGCGVVDPISAVIIGLFAGLLLVFGARFVEQRLRLDDAVDAIPVHLMNGIWGMVAVGLFANPDRVNQAYGHEDRAGLLYAIVNAGGDSSSNTKISAAGTVLGAQIVGVMFVLAWTFCTMFPFFMFLDWLDIFRIHPLDEVKGLDQAHGGITGSDGEHFLSARQVAAFRKRVEKLMDDDDEDDHDSPPLGILVAGDIVPLAIAAAD